MIARVHGVDCTSKSSVDSMRSLIRGHTCNVSCQSSVAILQKHKGYTKSTSRVQKYRMHKQESETDRLSSLKFPPDPPFEELLCNIIHGFSTELDPIHHSEYACAVCGKLTPVSHMVSLASVHNKLYLLEGEGGITRRERHTDDDPIEEIKGPILLPNADLLCHHCRSSLADNQVPVAALANGLWIGEVPEQLQNLTWAERTMIARVNHNRCVVRVKGSLQSKMIANAVCHTIPIPKVYNALPPSPEELDEVLAYIYIGPTRPVAKDHHRTPLLVRHNKVAAALEWLKLNHIDYADLTISYDNLKKYSEDGPPVVVDYHPGDGGKDEEAMAASDSQENEGTTEGPCPFVVHGLVGEQLMSMSTNALRAFALQHFKNKNHKALGIGQAEHPESLYSNPQLYPQMFPWLFPYGLGGPGNTRGFHQIPERERKCQLLMYHDKRFQNEPYFPLIAFNHEQIKDSTSGGFLLAEQHRFSDIADCILNLNNDVLDNLVNKLKEGQHYKPETQAEKDCYQLIQDVDHVAYKVKGSLANRKHMRNEIWSLISYLGAPSWFITFAPADVKHPLCLYFAHTGEMFKPELLDNDTRTRMIAANPVAGARFFNVVVELFIKHVLGVGTDHRGLYGDTAGYYGTVEQQGRMTLHLHLMLWIVNSLSPQEIRDRIMDPSSDFQQKMVEYLEGVHQAEFMDSTMAEMQEHIQKVQESDQYKDPTLTLPDPPPSVKKHDCKDSSVCETCIAATNWWTRFKETVNDIVYKSHRHQCSTAPGGCKVDMKTGKILKVCKCRFPRPVRPCTVMDPESGALLMKQGEARLNSYSPALTYLLRCNSDVTSLLSGTAIKAITAYVTDYITKTPLKTHAMFTAVKTVFSRNSDLFDGESGDRKIRARKLITKVVNALSASAETGAPMACMYLLGHPDHYTSHKFRPFYWRNYKHEVMKAWSGEDVVYDAEKKPTKVVIGKSKTKYVGLTQQMDYIHRPSKYEDVCLYD